jgi:PAS domain S-box-containing protein
MSLLPPALSSADSMGFVIVLIGLMALLLPGLLFIRLQRERQKLEVQNRRSLALIDLPKQAEALEEQEFMQYALEQTEALTGSQIGFMHFINDDNESIELIAWSKNTLAKNCTAVADRHYPISAAGIWADAARSHEPVIVNDYARVVKRNALPAGHSVMSRLLSVPVIESGKVRMITGVGNKADNYSAYDVETVQLIGNETWRIVCRQRTDKALRLAMQVVNASPVVCFRWAATDGWPIIFVSENVRQWGYTPEQLQSCQPAFASIVHPDDLARVAEEVLKNVAAGMTGYEQEYRLITAENKVIWVVDRTQVTRDQLSLPIFYDGVLTDITERKRQQLLVADTLAHQQQLNKRLEEANNQLLQSEKMASIGQLAAGIAHELNNPIGFVHSNLGTLDGYLHDLMTIIDAYDAATSSQGESCPHLKPIQQLREEHDFEFVREDIFKLLSESKDGLSRVRKIVQDLKTFSRVGEQEWQEADLQQGIDSTLNIVWNELKYKCQIIKEYGDIPPVYCLISQLNQVFMNLLVNAGHAIDVKGTITIRTRRLKGKTRFVSRLPTLAKAFRQPT